MVNDGPDLRDRYRGTLLGLAVGEALGAPADFLAPDQVVERYGFLTEMVGGGLHGVQPGEAIDATAMMLCLAESLGENAGFEPEDIMARYLSWFETAPRDVSLTVRTVMLSYRAGTQWDVASRRAFEILGSPGAANGSIMRAAPVGLLYRTDAETRHLVAHRESTLTHFDRLAGWACVAFSDLIVAALDGTLREDVPHVAAALDEEDRRVSDALREAVVAEPEEIQSSALVLDTLRTALWSVLRTSSFEEALCLTVNLGNDADTVGAVTGALAGALYGESAIPSRWLEPLHERERASAAADRLADLSGLEPVTTHHTHPQPGGAP